MPYKLTLHSPFVNNVGIDFSTEFTTWYDDDSIKYNPKLRCQYTLDRLKVITKKFKLVRVYSLLVAGWEKTLNLSAEGEALLNVMTYDNSIEGVIGTTLSKDWFMVQTNVNNWIDIVYKKLGTHTSNVKAIIIGNEINANGYTPQDIATIMTCFKVAQARYNLNIPVTVDFSNLPVQAGDAYSDSLVKAVVDNWGDHWNNWYPFVFINPYPDAQGIDNAKGVFDWQGAVSDYYQKKYPRLSILIGETGCEGAENDADGIKTMNEIFAQLTRQYTASRMTVPTFMFEALNEANKSDNPNQQHMGVYDDSEVPADGSTIKIKKGLGVPQWI